MLGSLSIPRYGHQDGVSAMDCLHRERPVSAGTSDLSLRAWKVLEESQLVFHGHKLVISLQQVSNLLGGCW